MAKRKYRFYAGTKIGDKFLCVVVKVLPDDPFVVTAYLTNRVKEVSDYGRKTTEDLV